MEGCRICGHGKTIDSTSTPRLIVCLVLECSRSGIQLVKSGNLVSDIGLASSIKRQVHSAGQSASVDFEFDETLTIDREGASTFSPTRHFPDNIPPRNNPPRRWNPEVLSKLQLYSFWSPTPPPSMDTLKAVFWKPDPAAQVHLHSPSFSMVCSPER